MNSAFVVCTIILFVISVTVFAITFHLNTGASCIIEHTAVTHHSLYETQRTQKKDLSCYVSSVHRERELQNVRLLVRGIELTRDDAQLTRYEAHRAQELADLQDTKHNISQAKWPAITHVSRGVDLYGNRTIAVDPRNLRFVLYPPHVETYDIPLEERYLGETVYFHGLSEVVKTKSMCSARTGMCDARQADGGHTLVSKISVPRQTHVSVLEHVNVGPCGQIFTQDNLFWNDGDYAWHASCCHMGGNPTTYRVTHFVEKAVVLFGPCWPDAFQHFAQDQFGKLGVLLPLLESDEDVTILIAGNEHAGSRKWLLQMGFPPQRILSLGDTGCGKTFVHVSKLYWAVAQPTIYPRPGPCINDFGKNAMDNVRKRVRSHLATKPTSALDVVYISRTSTRRGVQQETRWIKKLNGVLRSSGNETTLRVFKPKDKLKEGLEFVADADIVIVPHGGAVANLVVCKKGTIVIEIVHYCQSSYEHWLKLFGFVYYQVPVGPKDHNAPFIFPKYLSDVLRQAIQASKVMRN